MIMQQHYKTTQFIIQSNPTKKLYPINQLHLQSQFISTTYIPLNKCCYGDNKVNYFVTKIPNLINLRRNKQRRSKVGVNVIKASARETPYQVLGVSTNATPNDIKRAYRKLALKYHPDVNKEADAQEKFMRIKHAYNTLISSDSRKRYDSDTSYSTAERSRSTQQEEEFYGLGDFFKDLQEEFQNWEASASSQGKPKSLWEELADIGEEFVEFLEKELNITDDDTDFKQQPRRDPSESVEGQGQSNVDAMGNEGNDLKESIDEIEASLAKLKKELGLS